MSATATAPEKTTLVPPPGVLAPRQLFEAYRFERGQGRSQQEAAQEALNRNHVGPRGERERLTKQLLRQEQEFGLARTPAEIEAETIAEGEAAEAIAAEARLADPPADSVAAIRKDAQGRVPELERQRSRLAPEALSDAGAKAELLDVESELAEARRALELSDLADSEVARRERAAIEDAAQAAKAAALAKAHERQAPRERAVEKADKAAQAYVAALVEVRSVSDGQAADLARGGEGREQVARRRYNTDRATWGLCHALLANGGSDLLALTEEPAQRHAPLAATEPSPV
jgi:hypothetical protein